MTEFLSMEVRSGIYSTSGVFTLENIVNGALSGYFLASNLLPLRFRSPLNGKLAH